MAIKRKALQGVCNIIRFNWHFYAIAGLAIISAFAFQDFFPEQISAVALGLLLLAVSTIVISLVVSYYVYDFSDLYDLKWLPEADFRKVLNINAGFDETSEIIKGKFKNVDLNICDFYDKEKHTEVSIKRARRAYPLLKNTIHISTTKLPFSENTFDYAIAILSAHEIRDKWERVQFFKELNRVTKPTGRIFVTEHLRDWTNFTAYTIGFFHFHSKSTWIDTFKLAGLTLEKEVKTTPFITTFVLTENGDTL